MQRNVFGRSIHHALKLGRIVKPRFGRFFQLAKVEAAPPSLKEFINGLKEASPSKIPNMTFTEVGARLFLALELYCWFNVGEIIGRGHIIGYDPVDWEKDGQNLQNY